MSTEGIVQIYCHLFQTIITADNIVIATGMRPKYPVEVCIMFAFTCAFCIIIRNGNLQNLPFFVYLNYSYIPV